MTRERKRERELSRRIIEERRKKDGRKEEEGEGKKLSRENSIRVLYFSRSYITVNRFPGVMDNRVFFLFSLSLFITFVFWGFIIVTTEAKRERGRIFLTLFRNLKSPLSLFLKRNVYNRANAVNHFHFSHGMMIYCLNIFQNAILRIFSVSFRFVFSFGKTFFFVHSRC